MKNTNINISILFIILTAICFILYGKSGSFIYDSFREAIIPEQIIQGKLLYKDILCLFPPLGYYLNALLFKIFGSHLLVLYIASYICSGVIIVCIYKIMKELTSEKTAFYSALSVLLIFIFRHEEQGSASYFLPYSYSLIYALSFCFLSLTCLVLFNKKQNLKYMYFACLFSGISIAFKYDYLAFSLILLYFLLKQKSVKIFLKGLILFFIPTIITFGSFILYAGSEAFDILKNEVIYLNGFAANQLVVQYNKSFLPQSLSPEIINNIITSFIRFTEYIIVLYILSLCIYFIYKKLSYKKIYSAVFSLFLGLIIMYILFGINGAELKNFLYSSSKLYLHINFVFLPYVLVISTIILCIYKKIKNLKITETEKFFIIMLLSAYAIAFRDYAALYISNIGNFTAVAFWLLFIYFILSILPQNIKFLNNNTFKNSFCIALILYSLTYSIQYIYNAKIMTHKIDTPKGIIYVSDVFYPILNKSLTHAKENIQGTNKSLLYVEEGMHIHYLLDIPFIDTHIYALNPHNIPVLGEDYIINIIDKHKTDYIYSFISSNHSVHGDFGKDYAKEIFKYILDNYELESITEAKENNPDKSKLYIYKRKIKN